MMEQTYFEAFNFPTIFYFHLFSRFGWSWEKLKQLEQNGGNMHRFNTEHESVHSLQNGLVFLLAK
jgi:hypothetical protein